MTAVHDAGLAWYAAGCCVLPAAADGTKKPGVGSWDRFKAERPSAAILEGWLGSADGVGMVCGAISGGVEMLELEGAAVRYNIHVELRQALDAVAPPGELGTPSLWEKVNTYSEYTPGGGLHWIFRVEGTPVLGNTKLARAPREPTPEDASRVQTLIETRGEGGWTVLAPSGGRTHPTGKSWQTLSGVPGVVATLTANEYAVLHEVCQTFDLMPIKPVGEPAMSNFKGHEGELAPGEDFNQRASWEDVLTGWRVIYRRGEVTYWQRPGKNDRTISASTGHQGDWLYVFSTSTEFEAERTYTRFGAYAVLHHHGDHAAAAKALRKEGYGSATTYTDNVLTLIPGGAATAAVVGNTALVAEEDSSALTVSLTDDGNAQLLVMREKGRLHYNPQRGEWLHWTGERWQWDPDNTAAIEALRNIIRAITPANEAVRKHMNKSLSKRAIFDAVTLAARDPKIQVTITDLDADPLALNTPGGVVNLITGEVVPPRPEALHTRMTPCAPDFDRVPERWLRFLEETFQAAIEPTKMIEFVQRLAGYSACGKVTHHVLPFCHGSGGNGKTVFLEVLLALLGDYSGTAPADFLLAGKDVHESYTADLAGKRLVVCSEIPPTARFNEQKIKNLTGGDTLAGRFLYGKPFRFTPSHHLWLLGNHQPRVDAGGTSFWRRLRLIPFLHEVQPEDEIEGFADILVAEEGPAILAWIIAGARAQNQGLKEPTEVKSATTEYAVEEDALGRFLSEMVRFGGGKAVRVNTKAMRSAYESWCFTEGIKNPLPVSPFGRELKARNIEKMSSNGQNFYLNVTLMNRDDPSDLIERPEQTTWYEK